MSRRARKTRESAEHRSQQSGAEQRERLEREHYGLPLDQLHAHALTGDTLDLMYTVAERDGMHRCTGQRGRLLAVRYRKVTPDSSWGGAKAAAKRSSSEWRPCSQGATR
jgi:hypothetical protein